METNNFAENICSKFNLKKLLFYFILLLLLTGTLQNIYAQKKMSVSMNINLKVDTTKVRIYKLPIKEEASHIKTLVLKMGYGESQIINPKDAMELEGGGCNILSADVVYTDFSKKDVQDKLNRKRLTELYFLCPDVFSQSMTQWKYVEQLGYATEEDAKKLFHGVVIRYIKIPVYKPLTLKDMLGKMDVKLLSDTSLFKVFRKYIKRKDELVCADFTGSMSPYYLQLMVWISLKHSNKPLNFTFFNDGDATADYLKRTGNVGGLYMVNSNSIDTITKYAYRCVIGGNGGDTPENNIEAILKGLKKFPETKEIIMLADNWADMRDYALISEVPIPVRVILCGTNYFGYKTAVNPQYLDLARKTGGSVHTMEEELLDLASKKEGEEISLGGDKYIIRGGKFYKR